MICWSQNQATHAKPDRMNEAETRAQLIDPLLVAAGWGVVEASRIRRGFPIAPAALAVTQENHRSSPSTGQATTNPLLWHPCSLPATQGQLWHHDWRVIKAY